MNSTEMRMHFCRMHLNIYILTHQSVEIFPDPACVSRDPILCPDPKLNKLWASGSDGLLCYVV